eukprot:CAMPEP_0197347880 /NCGR_PEP_ID=MMETSP0893-20130614/7823_1 /TAXON_ID=44058 ORGANISM="Aureoumbra lagunensis, Strain CCMP1510" /NCGR_SAMPLE_ID=MMETSP0893 /ASSEMBLY_ACC=CAM_ASM_000539 /LENGTH=46 /DNA_ID= /DNA_START= /DNA_END= /DNA_ORIENTATION=
MANEEGRQKCKDKNIANDKAKNTSKKSKHKGGKRFLKKAKENTKVD